ncbi:hypothetical protein [Streptomyces sp. NPDC054834]
MQYHSLFRLLIVSWLAAAFTFASSFGRRSEEHFVSLCLIFV